MKSAVKFTGPKIINLIPATVTSVYSAESDLSPTWSGGDQTKLCPSPCLSEPWLPPAHLYDVPGKNQPFHIHYTIIALGS